jgi:SHS family lactate transporter-like MFS transporter
LGNLFFAAVNATLQASIAESHAGDNAVGLALVAGVTAIVIAVVAGAGKEAKDVRFGAVAAVS